MSTEIVKNADSYAVEVDGVAVACVVPVKGAEDSFARLSDAAWRYSAGTRVSGTFSATA